MGWVEWVDWVWWMGCVAIAPPGTPIIRGTAKRYNVDDMYLYITVSQTCSGPVLIVFYNQ